ncbi:Crp/Fnr family transcriptional regulator [Aliiroseovarius zhejiangensis]|uniref:Crp/Fnr family transcriptional regulator n=1 Tax=Aliiroseovarius zhejiangensis TaxID=1632025 RepID=A0ABQ3IPG4_9RHOB|nr:Crp/Fnr family transcriptional regulator [Aliiroseovarius zhejiangensis]GHE87767.1 Crp/Fnr family transcriptional regulator [Aliiroseovarius zhejiangensis]
MIESCLYRKLSHYVDIDDDSWDILARLEDAEESYSASAVVREIGTSADELFVVKSGWFYSFVLLPDGRRQIVSIRHPGDVVGFADIAYENACDTLVAASDGVLCPFPRKHLQRVFTDAPRVAALLFTLAVRDQVLLTDLLKATGRMSAREKLAYFLLELDARLRITNPDKTSFRLPLNQTEIGDTIGLTNVYVSKSLVALEQQGLVSRKDGDITILAPDVMKAMCDFQDRHSQMDVGWFPGAEDDPHVGSKP